MSIFGKIVSAIFKHEAVITAGPSAPASSTGPAPSAPSASIVATPLTPQQLEEKLDKISEAEGSDYDWRNSIVDLLKMLKLDSSLSARRQLAQELQYTGPLEGSSAMNMWLHAQVMRRLAESGGEVPADLKA